QFPDSRFIPAGAGNTMLSGIVRSLAAVYPRWRGEHRVSNLTATAINGLSPLARGTRDFHSRVELPDRFIPAGAGNTHYVPVNYK
ncbi:hypothetical protein SEEM162_19009, partial [Salmonella enterica subsp. enterica serovar Senftenberg str. 316235162]